MIHLDGMRETHDHVCKRSGVFDKAIAMVREGKRLGYHVYINTTVYKETRVEEVEELCQLVGELKANGILISPGYEYQSVRLGRGRDMFLDRDEIHRKIPGDPRLRRSLQDQRHANVSRIRRGLA